MNLYLTIVSMGAMIGAMVFWLGQFAWRMFQKRRWNICVPTFIQRGNSIVWDFNKRGRLVKNKFGYSIIKIRREQEYARPPKYDVLSISKSAEPVYPLFMSAKGQYFPVKAMLPEFESRKLTLEDFKNPETQKKILDALNGKLIPMKLMKAPRLELVEESGATNWNVLERKRVFDKFKPDQNWFEKYGQYMMNMIFMAVVIFVVIFMMTKFEVISGSLSGAADRLALAVETMSGKAAPAAANIVP